MFIRPKLLAYIAAFAACAGCASTEPAAVGSASEQVEQVSAQEGSLAQQDAVDESDAAANDEASARLEEILAAFNTGRLYDARRRLDLRLELARLDASQPHASAEKIWYDLGTVALRLTNEGRWEALLAVTQTLVATRDMVLNGADGGRGHQQQWATNAIGIAVHGLALWKTGRKALALEYFHAYIRHTEGFDDLAGLNHLLHYVAQSDEHGLAAGLIEHALGAASFSDEPNRIMLMARLGGHLLFSSQASERARGEALLHHCMLVAEHGQDSASVYSTLSQVASRHGLSDLQEAVTNRRLEAGYMSGYEVEAMAFPLLRGGDFDQLEDLVDRYTKGHEDAVFLTKASGWFVSAGDSRRAYEYMKRALEQRPDATDWWRQLAELGFEIGEDEEALEALQTFIEKGGGGSWQVQAAARVLQQANREEDALGLLERAARENSGDIRLVSQIVYAFRGRAQEDRVGTILLDIASEEDLPSHTLSRLAQLIEREVGADAAASVFVRAAKAGDEKAIVRVVIRAVQERGRQGLAELFEQLEPFEKLSFNSLAKLWYQVEHRLDADVQVAFLEQLLAKAPAGQSLTYRTQLTNIYVARDDIDAAFHLWDDSRPVQFQQLDLRRVEPDTRRALLDEFEARYTDGAASAWMLFFMGEQYWALWKRGGAKITGDGESDDGPLSKARSFYLAAVEAADEGTDFVGAMRFFENRQFNDIAEAALTRQVRLPQALPHAWFEYGDFLVRRGRFEAAEKVMLRYVNEQHSTGPASDPHIYAAIAARFRSAHEPAHAEYFYRMALNRAGQGDRSASHIRNLLGSAGQGLGELLLEQGRIDDFLEVTSDYHLKYRGEHPYLKPHDRAVDLTGLREQGLWEPYLERMDKLSDIERLSEYHYYPRALWNVGRRDDAWEAFEAQVDQGYAKSSQWLQVAVFLESRGSVKFAATAFDRAVRLAEPGRNAPAALLSRAQHLVWQGHFEAAIADYDTVARSVYGPNYAFEVMLSTFTRVGRRALAFEAARDPESPFKQLVPPTFDAHTLRLAPDELANRISALGGLPASSFDVPTELERHGRADVLDVLARQKLARGDRPGALQVLATGEDLLAEADLLDPLLSEMVAKTVGSPEPQLQRLLLEKYLRQGDRRGALDVAGRWINRGHTGLAMSLKLAQPSDGLGGYSLSRQLLLHSGGGLPVEFYRFGRSEELSQILRDSGGSVAHLRLPVELYISDLFRRGGSVAVFSLLRRSAYDMVQDGELVEANPHSAHLLATSAELGRALALVAAHGYATEVAAFVEELPTPLQESAELAEFAGALSKLSAEEVVEEGDADMPRPPESLSEVHVRSYALIASDQFEAAEAVLLDAFERPDLMELPDATLRHQRYKPTRQTYYAGRSHLKRGGKVGVEGVLELLLRVYVATGEPAGGERVARLWTQHMSETEHRTLRLVKLLENYGFFDQAAKVAFELMQRSPTRQVLEKALMVAAKTRQHDRFEELLATYWRQHGFEGGILGSPGFTHTLRTFEPGPANKLIERILSARPAVIDTRLAQISVQFDAGHVHQGRVYLKQYVRDFSRSEEALEELTRRLGADGYAVELARVFWPEIDIDRLTIESLIHLGHAHLELGLEDQALELFVVAIERHADVELGASRLVRDISIAGYVGAAGGLAEKYLEDEPRLRLALYARGLARLAGGGERAEADLGRGLERRSEDVDALGDVSLVALRAGNDALAERCLRILLGLPSQPNSGRAHPLREVIDIVIRAERAGWGVEFLDRHLPTLLEEPFLVSSSEWTLAIGEVFTAAGLGERAEAWYARSWRYFRLQPSHNPQAAHLLEARAYNLLVNDGDPERAASMSRSAAALAGSRDAIVLATLALSQHKAGHSERAKATLRRAVIKGFPRPTYPLVLDDLAEAIADARIADRRANANTQSALSFYNQINAPYLHSQPQSLPLQKFNRHGLGGGGLIRGGHLQGGGSQWP